MANTDADKAAGQAGPEAGPQPPPPWFAEKDADLLLYRVNRRPLMNLFGGQQPEDVFDHIVEVLLFGATATTGRAYKREWRLGNRDINIEERVLTGQLGFERAAQQASDQYDIDTHEWVDVVEPVDITGRAPFAFDANSRILGVLKHPTFSETTVPAVFETLLRQGEEARELPSTDWAVEPILDDVNFLRWLREADAVTKVSFTARLPNPDGEEEFQPVWGRLQERRAKALREVMEAANDDQGLRDVADDETARAYIAMGANGYGTVSGTRRRHDRIENYNQREKVKRDRVGPAPSTWPEVAAMVLNHLVATRQRRDNDDG